MELAEIKRGNIITVTITDTAFGGKGIAKINTPDGDYVIFVPNTFTGQKVSARVVKRRKKHAECKLVEIIEKSHLEEDMPFQPISGAPFINLPIAVQKEFKKDTCLNVYKRIGRCNNIEEVFDKYIESPEVFHYRNKMEYSFSAIGYDLKTKEEFDGFALGFKKRGTWWIVENLEKESGIFDEEFENKLNLIKSYCENSGLPAWHPPKKVGFFRYLVVRKSYKDNQLLLKLVTSDTNIEKFDFKAFTDFVVNLLGDRLAGLLHTINNDIGDNAQSRIGDDTLLYGKSTINEDLLGLSFEISMQSFFQTNPKCAELLYNKTIEYALEGNENISDGVVMDLFCGTGTIGQIIASKTNAKVIGVDIVEEAIENAKENAIKNNIQNVEFFAADVNKFLFEYPEYQNKIGTIILDPPRAGISGKALKRVIELNAKHIVYVSCNPATQARDMEDLFSAGYELKKLSLVDQFPHTSHVEAIALFQK
ncbi:23S rRNA (uracil(1939)-C(5))-methyltransferase RlmD [Vicingus serpentipes]|uniref:23S rRNA (Uracil(1939)-C(5))-methyltransferase RlmD n=1 Tax=Vicingus serpentipes TaxID=1926625 RepID=A0A5C6RVP8_9FLAO|nr:23S rRNA (uracil(1939)-C(5))-methyltransferase RlmD [Vicingus serpentipes]TXB66616.1 23S rRNA (uracil(1939)-C(5))-methyltransferase RlmD [Vicingus serpentipes]